MVVQLRFCADTVIRQKEVILLTPFIGRSLCHQKKKKTNQTTEWHQQLIKGFVNGKTPPCFPKLISSMVTDNFLCLIFLNLFLERQSRICLPDAVNSLWGLTFSGDQI